jgi:hypothetical protein
MTAYFPGKCKNKMHESDVKKNHCYNWFFWLIVFTDPNFDLFMKLSNGLMYYN